MMAMTVKDCLSFLFEPQIQKALEESILTEAIKNQIR